MRLLRALSISLFFLTATASAASASTTIGELPTPAGIECGELGTVISATTGPKINSYAVPSGGGVITAWQTRTGNHASEVKLKVGRPTSNPKQFLIVGEDGPDPVAANTSPRFTSGVRIPVQAGDRIGLVTFGSGTDCIATAGDISTAFGSPATDVPPGSTAGEAESSGFVFEISATVEPDADHDGYGDETQDQCPDSAAAHIAPCPPSLTSAPPAPSSGIGPAVAPALRLTSKPRQAALKSRAVTIVASADESVVLDASGSVSVPGGGAFSLATASTSAAANSKATLSLRIPKQAVGQIAAALKRGKTPHASVHVVARNPTGLSSSATQSIAIVKPPSKKHKG